MEDVGGQGARAARFGAWCIAIASGPVWVYLTVVAVIGLSDAEHADRWAGDRFALAMLWYLSVVMSCLYPLFAYPIARSAGWTIWRALFLVQAGLFAVSAAMFLFVVSMPYEAAP